MYSIDVSLGEKHFVQYERLLKNNFHQISDHFPTKDYFFNTLNMTILTFSITPGMESTKEKRIRPG